MLGDLHGRDGYPVNWPEQPATWVAEASALGAWVVELDGRVVGHIGLRQAGAISLPGGGARSLVWGEGGWRW